VTDSDAPGESGLTDDIWNVKLACRKLTLLFAQKSFRTCGVFDPLCPKWIRV
jgi:hypothetical protein